jgi:periplasmic protein TonB
MGYQALLFCPDEKTARTVTQVLSELDFAVTPCTEPFAAVKKLMAEHFDAVVVDCDNEQNATLLFKSARNTTTNQSSLAVAVVEGQAGVAKAFRIGANLILTKPINVEQAKGTLRVARGLLRKNEGSKPATTSPSAKPAAAVSAPVQPTTTSHLDVASSPAPSSPMTAGATASASSRDLAKDSTEPFETGEIVSPMLAKPAAQPYASDASAASVPAKVEMTSSRAAFGNSAASAPAPAREPKAGVSTEDKPSTVLPEAEPAGKVHDRNENEPPIDGQPEPAPMFTFGGTISSKENPAGGGSKKLLLAVAAAVVLIAAGGYAAWTHWGRSNDTSAVPEQVVEPQPKTPAAIPQAPNQAPVTKPSASDTQKTASAEKIPDHPGKITAATDSAKPSPSSVVANKAPATKEDAEPIVIKNNLSKPATKSRVINDAPAPPSIAIAPAGNGGGLPNLMDSQSEAPTPVLQTLSVSQGVSQGLLLKKVQPKYPPNALRLRLEGAVQLMATISKNGDISVVKLLTGDPQLSHAAIDAVKQWKYKPYLLNGEPVEIQTQITVNFKLPN